MTVQVLATHFHILNMHTRMPFRYGIATLTALPHLFVQAEVLVDGRLQLGLAAEGLPPKWFTKDPAKSFEDEVAEMLAVIQTACDFARAAGEAASVFELWRAVYTHQQKWGTEAGYPPLLWSFGVSLVERAVIDAFCRATQTPFAVAVHENTLGVDLAAIHASLAGHQPNDLLPPQPLDRVRARHTVGLTDPLTEADISPAERLEDGLPQSLEACIRTYGLTHFKIKVSGNTENDLERMKRIASVLERTATGSYAFTLDGNEQYTSMASFRAFWEAMLRESTLARWMQHLLFVEQPLHRDVALDPAVGEELERWPDRPAMIIDESDGTLDSLPRALACGYNGTSHKNCKGVFKGLANACLIAQRRRVKLDNPFMLSGEDLATVGPVALLQDLAVVATLGVDHVERNGHHYFTGLSMLPADWQARVLEAHPDLYRLHEHGFPTLKIENGTIHAGSVVAAPFGYACPLDPTRFPPPAKWRFASLGKEE